MYPTTAKTEVIRQAFPALERVHNGYPVAYFDGPGGTQVPAMVTDAMVDYLLHHNANTHWAYPSSAETDAILDDARAAFADFLNCRPAEVVFGQNMTTLTFHLARSLGRQWHQGDEIIVTDLDHHANIDPWRDLARERNLVIHSVRFDIKTGQLDLEHLDSLINTHTRLIAIGGASNALGTINDLPKVIRLAQQANALTFVDAVHYAPHVLCDMKAFECDFLTCSPYKFYGPHAGVLYGKEKLLQNLNVPRLEPAGSTAPERLETGTLSHEAITGSAEAVNFLASLTPIEPRRAALKATYQELHERGQHLVTRLWEGLYSIPGIICYGPPPLDARTPTVGFTIQGLTSEEACKQLSNYGLFLSHGDFYASTVVSRLGVEGLIRAGVACYTTGEEIDRLLTAVRKISR